MSAPAPQKQRTSLSRSEQKKMRIKFDALLKRFDIAFGRGEVADIVTVWTEASEIDMTTTSARRLKHWFMQQINETKRRYHRVKDAQILFEAFKQLCPDLPDTVTNMDNLTDPQYMILHVPAKKQKVEPTSDQAADAERADEQV